MKIGCVITTHGNNGIYAIQCIDCFLRNIPNGYIVLYVNNSTDPKILNIKNEYPNIEYIYIEDQDSFGGLTGTWNSGIDLCINNNCEIIILSNDDVFFDKSINNIVNEAYKCKKTEMKYYGPVTNNPGVSNSNYKNQYSLFSQNKQSYVCKNNNKYFNINGFFMVFPIHVLKNNMYSKKYYFNPSFPFDGNEVEWFNRFNKKNGIPIIVPRTFVYHYKLKNWRNNKIQNDACIYTINFGNYENLNINLKNNTDLDILYFTDNLSMDKGSQIYNCIVNNIIFFYVNTKKHISYNWWPNYKELQRIIKINPSGYIPNNYNKTLYVDGNIVFKKPIYKKDIDNILKNKDIVCFNHPDRNTVLSESIAVVKLNVDKKENTDKILEIIRKNNFLDNIGLTETCILFRNHKNIKEFSEEWEKLIKICIRDQISFDYLLWKYKINYIRYPIKYRNNVIIRIKHENPKFRNFIENDKTPFYDNVKSKPF